MSEHRPVLYHEIIHALCPQRDRSYVDATVGAGGHALGILQASEPNGRLLGFDVDPKALSIARERLFNYRSRVVLILASYTTLLEQLNKLGWNSVDGILLDLGVSSMQLDTAERGFSFRMDGPLDMRFDPNNPVSAAELVNHLPEKELADILYRYGEEKRSRQVAKAIVQSRPLYRTGQLAEIVAQVTSGRRKGFHPATRTFQALRIAVNNELRSIEEVLPQAINALVPGGRLAVISFHSLEDRIVKNYFRRESRDCICLPNQPICTCGHLAVMREITRRPIKPQKSEMAENPRSRSARLRVAEKLETKVVK